MMVKGGYGLRMECWNTCGPGAALSNSLVDLLETGDREEEEEEEVENEGERVGL